MSPRIYKVIHLPVSCKKGFIYRANSHLFGFFLHKDIKFELSRGEELILN